MRTRHSHQRSRAKQSLSAANQQWAFSVLKCFILKGNYHVGLERLSAELALAANSGRSHVTTITAELLVEAKAMLKRVDN